MFKAPGNKNYSIHEMKNTNHQFQTVILDRIQNSEDVDETISPIVLDLIGSWFKIQVLNRKLLLQKKKCHSILFINKLTASLNLVAI
jgi:hypothetical protein